MYISEELFNKLNMGDNTYHRCVFCNNDPTIDWMCKCRKIFKEEPDRFYLCECGDWYIIGLYEDCGCLYEFREEEM